MQPLNAIFGKKREVCPNYIDPDNRKICLRVFQLKKSGFLNNLNVQVKVEPKKYSPNNTSIDPPKICGKFFPPEAEALHLEQGCFALGAMRPFTA